MSDDAWLFRIDDMLNALAEIEDYLSDIDQKDFAQDRMRFRAIERCFEILGEAAQNVPKDIVARFPAVPWRDMKTMRNFVAHEYGRVNAQIVWDTIQRDLPPLKQILLDLKRQMTI